jgi:F0F1-type ATP synthase assembly protein I
MSPEKRFPNWVRYSSVGIEFAAAIVGFTLVGYWIDRQFGSAPWGLVAGLVLGFVGGFYNLVKQAIRATKEARIDDELARAREPGDRNRTEG